MSAFDAIKRWLPFAQRSNEVAMPRAEAMKAVFDLYRKTMFDPVRRKVKEETGKVFMSAHDVIAIRSLSREDVQLLSKTAEVYVHYVKDMSRSCHTEDIRKALRDLTEHPLSLLTYVEAATDVEIERAAYYKRLSGYIRDDVHEGVRDWLKQQKNAKRGIKINTL